MPNFADLQPEQIRTAALIVIALLSTLLLVLFARLVILVISINRQAFKQ